MHAGTNWPAVFCHRFVKSTRHSIIASQTGLGYSGAIGSRQSTARPPNHVLYQALGKLFPHADENHGRQHPHDTPSNSRTIATAAMHCATLNGMDVISLFRIRLRKPIINNMDSASQTLIKQRREGVTAIHVRKGDVSTYLFNSSTFRPRFDKVVKALHYYCMNPLEYDETYNGGMLKLGAGGIQPSGYSYHYQACIRGKAKQSH